MKDLFNQTFKDKKILITGDTGFKGSWLAIWLSGLGADIIGYALPPKHEYDNYVVTDISGTIKHIDGDIRDGEYLKKVVQQYQPQFVFHLAAQSLVLESYEQPAYTFDTNLMGTVNLFEACLNSDATKVIVNVTSDKCYNNCEWHYGYRETDSLGGNDPYSASKAAAEIISASYFQSFFRNKKIQLATVRAGNVIGGRDWGQHRIVPDCMRALANNEAVSIRNPGAVRPWQYVLEPLRGYLQLARQLHEQGDKFTGAWNFGPAAGNMINVKSLVEKIIAIAGKGSFRLEKDVSDRSEKEAHFLHLDISKARNLLNWHPVLDINQSIEFTVEQYDPINKMEKDLHALALKHIDKYSQLVEAEEELND